MEDCVVIFKGTINGLVIILREEDSFDSIIKEMESKIEAAGKFFKGASISVKYRGKNLSDDEENQIFDLLIKKSGAEIKSIQQDVEETVSQPEILTESSIPKLRMNNYFFQGIEEGITKFHKGTLRSGKRLSFDGNLVVIGDVNPGAEVIATGNVIVMGSLRGVVHAGSNGNKEAIVVALGLQPTQLRISDVITRSPDEKGSKNIMIPELALVKDDMVYIERFLPQREVGI